MELVLVRGHFFNGVVGGFSWGGLQSSLTRPRLVMVRGQRPSWLRDPHMEGRAARAARALRAR